MYLHMDILYNVSACVSIANWSVGVVSHVQVCMEWRTKMFTITTMKCTCKVRNPRAVMTTK